MSHMTFEVPTRRVLIARAQADIDARLKGADSRLHASNLNVLSIVHAGGMDGLYRYAAWIARQMYVKTCDEAQLLIRANELGVPRKDPSRASGYVSFPASSGSVIPAVSDLVRSDGVRYQVVTEASAVGGSITVFVRANEAGAVGNVAAAASLSLLTPVPGVQSSGTVGADGISGGSDIEGVESWRDRVLRRMRQAPQGGSKSDYETWALEVPGVTRVWVAAHEMGVGTVTVRFVRDNDDNIIPDAGEVDAVQAYIASRRPITAKALYVAAPIPVPRNFTISLVPGTSVVKANVEASLRDFIRREAEPGELLLITHIAEAISTAIGEDDHVLTSPTANVPHAPGELAVMGVITWI